MSPAESTSTGPRTVEGKIKSSLNATRHGLTGRVVVLPSEDLNAYQSFCKELMAELAPVTAIGRQYAQTFCDTQWRLNRARSYEDSMLALGHLESESNFNVEHPEVQAALAAGKQFRDHSKAFVNLSLYEQRLQRAQKEALRQLRELQTERKAAGDAEGQKDAECQTAQTKAEAPAIEPKQFVCSTPAPNPKVPDLTPLSRPERPPFPQREAA